MTSFFDQVTRWQVRPGRNPAENRLTAALASVLQEVSPLALLLLDTWAPDVKPSADPEVTPQRQVGSRAIDVEIAAGTDALVWVEAKYRAPSSGPDQLENYLHDLRTAHRAAEQRLVLLIPAARRGEDFHADVTWDPHDKGLRGPRPTKVLGFTWQEIDRLLCSQRGGPFVHRWLKEQLHEFLSDSGLADKPLNQPLIRAFNMRWELDNTLSQLAKTAGDRIADTWGPNVSSKRGTIYQSELEYRIPRNKGRNWGSASRLVWGAYVDPGGSSFYAGLRCANAGPLTKPTNAGWREGLETDGFCYEDDGQHWLALHRKASWLVQYKDALLQATKLADWVMDAFERVTREHPPA